MLNYITEDILEIGKYIRGAVICIPTTCTLENSNLLMDMCENTRINNSLCLDSVYRFIYNKNGMPSHFGFESEMHRVKVHRFWAELNTTHDFDTGHDNFRTKYDCIYMPSFPIKISPTSDVEYWLVKKSCTELLELYNYDKDGKGLNDIYIPLFDVELGNTDWSIIEYAIEEVFCDFENSVFIVINPERTV